MGYELDRENDNSYINVEGEYEYADFNYPDEFDDYYSISTAYKVDDFEW